jgi:lambda family phage tail tape measure protein
MASLKYTVDVDTRGARSSIASLQKAFGGLGSTIAGGFALGGIIQFTDSIINLQNKLRSLTGNQELATSMFNDITRVATAARAPLQETGDLYFRIARAARDLGISQQETSDITESLAKSMSMTGATAQETSGALLQLGQALQSGRFQGDELRSVLENMPIVSKAMADELGVTIGELRKLGSEGKITSDVFVRAMQKNKKAIDDAFARSVPTAEQALNNLKTTAATVYEELKTQGADAGPAGALIKGFDDLLTELKKLTTDIPTLTTAIKELADVLVLLGLTFAAVKAAAVIGPVLLSASAGVTKLGSSIGAVIAEGKVLTTVFGSLKSGAGGLGARLAGAFSVNAIKGNITTVINLGKNIGMLIPLMFKTGNIIKGVQVIFGGLFGILGRLVGLLPLVLRGFVRFIPIAGWIWTIWEAIDALLKLFTGNGIVYWLGVAADKIDNFFQKFLGVRIISDYVVPTINTLMDKLRQFAEYVGILDKKGPKGGNKLGGGREAPGGKNRAVTDAFDASMSATKKDDVFGDDSTRLTPKPDDGKPTKTAKDYANALRDVKKAILEITSAFRENSAARLDDLNFQFKSLMMSEDQVALESQRRDILKEQKTALADLDAKQIEINESEDLNRKGKAEALALIAQQRVAINTAASEELAAAEKTLQAIQAVNIEREKANGLIELQNLAASNKVELQNLEDQLKLVGLYGDNLENVTAQLELQQKLREIELEYQTKLRDLDNERLKIGEARYQNQLANLQALTAEQQKAAKAQADAQKKLVDLKREAERNDIGGAIGKRLEELERSVDPAVTAVEGLNSLFSNMGSALDNFVDTGKLKFGDFAKSVIADIAKIALKAAVTKLFTLVGKSILGLAAGGPVMANKPYVVGEQGPELFVPNSAGSIMTNASLNKNAGTGDSGMGATVNNTYITNNISAIDSRSVAQMFVENRKSLLGASMMARKEMPYGG